MSYQVLARKWRPKKFQDVIGQGHVTRSLQNAIANKKIGHAYMMVGTRGVGKTSVARIFAKAIRCESLTTDLNSCGECKSCLDFDTETSMNIIEIDGASNNSVDNIRELISNVHYLPTSGQYKVYIIDEVHMLSANAFNALLKTLEEPPAHVIFIFATTEAHKLLGTVLSRCQRFDFRNVPTETLSNHLKEIAKIEGIKFENDSIPEQIATLGRGSVRDTLSLMDQVLTFSENNFVLENSLTYSLGIAGAKTTQELKNSIYNGDDSKVSKIYNALIAENVTSKNIFQALLESIARDVSGNSELGRAEIIWVYETLAKETTWVFDSISPDKTAEIALLKVCLRRSFFGSLKQSSNSQTNQVDNVEKKSELSVNQTIAVEPKIEEINEATRDESTDSKLIDVKSLLQEAANELENMDVYKVETQVSVLEVAAEIPKEVDSSPKSWEGFLNELLKKSPATASNLEQGNVLKPVELVNGKVDVEIGFGYSGEVFIEYLQENEVYQKLQNNIAAYFNISPSDVSLKFERVNQNEEFVSSADMREMKAQENEKEKVAEFKNNPLLIQAEKIFNSKIDKVILNNKGKE